jgi:hypothetical protein
MSRQYFADVLSEPLSTSFATITATTETVLIPTIVTAIPANEPRGGKVYKLTVGGIWTTGTAGTITITPRYGTTISGTALGASPAQNYVPSISNAPFLFEYWLAIRAIGQAGANSTVVGTGRLTINGAAATAASSTIVTCGSTASVSVDTSVASALWIGITSSVAPSITPLWHMLQSPN